jgi:hypothetical protein
MEMNKIYKAYRRFQMKKLFLLLMILLFSLTANADAAFVSGSTGANGAFNPTTNTEVTLPADGILNYTTVNIPSGVTVTFKKNAANTPVYILATGDVVIAGTIKIDGGDAIQNSTLNGSGGPGGYDGGFGGASNLAGGKGFGPGGGEGGPSSSYRFGGGGSFGTAGYSRSTGNGAAGAIYGNERLVPLIGGSGGGGMANGGHGGAGGGGAILIASSTTITLTGRISANGGNGRGYWFDDSSGGSGGAVKLMANVISGSGIITAKGGTACCGNAGGAGRIRIEAYTNNLAATDPPYTYGLPGSVFPANAPILRITSIAGVSVPSSPTGSYSQPDIMLPNTTTNPVAVNISAAYIPVGTTVTVSVIPQYGSATNVNATLSGTSTSSTASASVTLSTQYSNIITAQATYALQTAMYYEGEKIERVRIAATMGGESEAVYISESGREIKSKELILAGLLK